MLTRSKFTVELPAHADRPDGTRPTFTFREGTCRERIQADEAYDFEHCKTASEIIARIFPLVKNQLIEFVMVPGQKPEADAEKLHDALTMRELVQLFVAMRTGMDVTFDEKKDLGSESPSEPVESPPTTTPGTAAETSSRSSAQPATAPDASTAAATDPSHSTTTPEGTAFPS